MAGDENCCICLESLFAEGTVLGVCSPCGHPFHEACFRTWEANKMSARGSYFSRQDLKCPTCNTPGASFTKIFITFPTVDNAVSDDDSDDESSVGSIIEYVAQDAVADEAEENAVGDEEKDEEKESESNDSSADTTVEEGGNDSSSSRDSVVEEEQHHPQQLVQAHAASRGIDAAEADLLSNATSRSRHHQQQQQESDDGNDNVEEPEVVDLSCSPPRTSRSSRRQQQRESSGDRNRGDGRSEEELIQRRKAKRYKKLVKQMKSKYDELGKKQHELHKTVKSAKDEAKAETKKATRMQEDHDQHMHELRNARLDIVRLERELDEETQAKQSARLKFKNVAEEYEQEKAGFQVKIDRARKLHTVEMDKIIKDYPLVLEEKQRLEAALQSKIKYVASLKKKLQEVEPQLRKHIELGLKTDAPPDQRQIKKNLMMMNAMSDEHQVTDVKNKRKRELVDLQSKARKRSSQRAVHMVESVTASASVKHANSRRTNIDNLLGGTSNNKKRPTQQQSVRRVSSESSAAAVRQPVRQPASASHGGTSSTKAKTVPTSLSLTKRNHKTDRHQGGFSKKSSSKSSGQGDLRSMFQAKR